jgi:hypothetical protein
MISGVEILSHISYRNLRIRRELSLTSEKISGSLSASDKSAESQQGTLNIFSLSTYISTRKDFLAGDNDPTDDRPHKHIHNLYR